MSETLRNQLLGLGFKPAPKPERPKPAPQGGKPQHGAKPGQGKPAHGKPAQGRPQHGKPPHANARPPQGKPRTREDIDLAKAYAIRAQKEKDERIEAERQKQEAARQRREAKAALATFLQGKGLNVADAEIARHFEYGGKIKRVYVTQAQLAALNAGELGVLQNDGRYVLVDAATLAQAEAIFAPAVALKVDPDAPPQDDPYADPQYQVPDDLVW
ncbi:Nucleoprotein/polynucleotide-associated enzyme [Lysobacter dokdonensis DS-58]|uniref:Nucleoprotein/polynucleotide-associated enzyme n=1 Tax=Lysobacter dokdonensis DS-58 TaxID=1300345 RepID=A0A0A2WKH6_9GAMM|nr:DUF2058 family protein [Lysobacter dokdonensis]KGQ20323.1 Nucleoprotein/polynucleotide-associated enzyme [Lysobacter dokdonensis DS-58]